MNTTKKFLMGLAAFAALALGGSAIASATGSNAGDGDGEKADGPDATVAAPATQKAGDAAVTAVGGGKVLSVERSDEGGPAVYEVKVDRAGKITEVSESKDFAVTDQQADDDQGDGDGENPND